MTSVAYRQRNSRLPDPTSVQVSSRPATQAMRPPKYDQPGESRKHKPTPFDPDDLCRRLQVVLAEEKAYIERKRRSRANIDRASDNTQPARDVSSRSRREVPIEIAAYQATADRSAQITAARRSVLTASAAKRLSRDQKVETGLPQPPDKGDVPSYHHIPRVAATQFERTTAHEPVTDSSLVHKLSRKAMKFHMENPSAHGDSRGGSVRPDEQVKTLHRVQGEREKIYGRNQFQHPAMILEASGDLDDKRDREAAYRQTFDALLRGNPSGLEGIEDNCNPRLSSSSARGYQRGGAAHQDSSEFPTGIYPVLTHESVEFQDIPTRTDNHRVDWTQSDEKPISTVSPNVLRKTDSKWKLKNRLSFHLGNKSEKDLLQNNAHTASPALRSPRSSFFARFRRQQVT